MRRARAIVLAACLVSLSGCLLPTHGDATFSYEGVVTALPEGPGHRQAAGTPGEARPPTPLDGVEVALYEDDKWPPIRLNVTNAGGVYVLGLTGAVNPELHYFLEFRKPGYTPKRVYLFGKVDDPMVERLPCPRQKAPTCARVNVALEPLPAAPPAEARPAHLQLRHRFEAYYAAIQAQMRRHWIVPEWALKRDIAIPASVRIGRDGRLLSARVERRSGHPDLDDSVLKALEKARQVGLPPLPPEYPDDELVVVFEFNPLTRR